jgi:hypothetical protein
MNDVVTRDAGQPRSSGGLNAGLWVVQALLSLTFAGGAAWKLATPLSTIAAMMPWAGQVSPAFFYFTAGVDLAGGLGIVLPSLTGIKPGLVVPAALGCVALQICAIVFHLSRGEAANTPLNFVLVALALFVAWGRRKVPIRARSAAP